MTEVFYFHIFLSYFVFQSRGPKKPVGYPSLQAHIAQQQLIHNIHPLPISDMTRTGNMLVQYTALNQQVNNNAGILKLTVTYSFCTNQYQNS